MIIGITGGIGTGKSTVTNMLIKAGYAVYDCDAVVAGYYKDPTIVQLLEMTYGHLGDDPKGAIARLAWENPDVLASVTGFMLGYLTADLIAVIKKESANDALYFIDGPTLIETGLHTLLDKTIVIDANCEIRWDRVQNRQGMTRDKFDTVRNNQLSDDERNKFADYLIDNSYDKDQLERHVFTLLEEINAANSRTS